MAEGIMTADGQVGLAVHDNPDHPPAADADAPRGWTWDRRGRKWKPRVRGPVVYQAQAAAPRLDLTAHDDAASFEPGADYDPAPGWAADPGPADNSDKWVPDKETRNDIKALIALCYTVPSEALPLVDPYCFAPLTQRKTADGVIDAVTDIVCGSPKIARWAASSSGLMPWLKLAIALKPIGVNFLHHHITKSVSVEVDREAREMVVTETDWSQFPAA